MAPRVVGRLGCRVLVCETEDGLLLVDSGFGTRDIADPSRLGPARHLLRAALDPAETALRQIEGLGLDPADVRHIVLTHLDLDHVGGISDFPDAMIHTTAVEHRAAMVAPSRREARRYRPVQWSHGPRLRTYADATTEWQGLAAGWSIEGVGDDVALLPMPGHSRGHAAVGVRTEGGLLVHAGDAVFDAASIGATGPDGRPLPPRRALRAFEQVVAHDRGEVARNHARLAAMRDVPGVTVFGAHDLRPEVRVG